MTTTFMTTRAGKILAPREVRIGERLPYSAHQDDVTLISREGLLIQTLQLTGLAFETEPDEELNYRRAVREAVLRGAADPRLAIYHHVVRRRVTPEFQQPPREPFCAALNARWQAQLASRKLYVNDIFLSFVLSPLKGGVGLLERLVRGAQKQKTNLDRDLRQLSAAREAFGAALAPYGARVLSLYDGPGGTQRSEPAEFISLIVNGELRPVLAPSGDLGHAVASRRLSFGFDAMEFAEGPGPAVFGAMVSFKDYPARTAPGLLDGILRLPMEMVLTETFSFVDRQAALSRMGLVLRRLKAADDDAHSLRVELAEARDDVGAGRAAYGEHHLSVLVKAENLDELDANVAEVQSSFAEVGAIAVREDLNLEPAFWAQFPGNRRFIARKALISAANFAGLASFHNYPVGQASGNHWGPALCVLETTANGPYHFNFHHQDLGNFTVIGPSGSGKTVLITFLLAQAERLEPRIAYFDKDRGAEAFIRAIGGRYDVLAPGRPTGFNPLQLPDSAENRAFLIDWVAQLLTAHGGQIDPDDRSIIVDAIDANYAQPPAHRRLRYFRELLRGRRRPAVDDLAALLSPWCGEGDHAWLFDNAEDRLDVESRIVGFDMTRLLDTPVIRTPAMMYLFHRVEQRLDGSPAILVVDEGWKALDDPVFLRRIKDWEKTIRKRNGVVGFCTQSASDALESRIASAIVEQAATQIFFPNARAKAADFIGGFGLTEHEFELVRTLPDTSRCFLIKRGDHAVVAKLDLSGLPGELSLLGGTERTVRRLDALRAEVGDEPEDWLERFMEGRSAA
jgi:type IV secretion system protein VirB4